MVLVKSSMIRSKKPMVNVEVIGIVEAQRVVQDTIKRVLRAEEFVGLKAANYVQQEVQESIMGNRGEHKSVDTGDFANSVVINKLARDRWQILPKGISYANALEYGTSRGLKPRRHFRNTKARTEKKVLEIFNTGIKQAVKR